MEKQKNDIFHFKNDKQIYLWPNSEKSTYPYLMTSQLTKINIKILYVSNVWIYINLYEVYQI